MYQDQITFSTRKKFLKTYAYLKTESKEAVKRGMLELLEII
jgi:hypothetical protein